MQLEASGQAIAEFARHGVLGRARSIAYDHAQDFVYVTDNESKVADVFGPQITGTVPDVGCGPAEGVTRTSASVHCTINPREVPNSFNFEWAVGGNEVQHLHMQDVAAHHVPIEGTFKLGAGGMYTEKLPVDVPPGALQSELEALPSIGPGDVRVTGTTLDPAIDRSGDYDIEFIGELKGLNVPLLAFDKSDLRPENPAAPFIETTLTTEASGPDWTTAKASAAESIEPPDNANHLLSRALTGLKNNTAYSVRLAATNTENHLKTFATEVFKTLPPPPPKISNFSISNVTASEAHVSATVDSTEEPEVATNWRILLSPDTGAGKAECEALPDSEFTEAEGGTISAGSPPVEVAASLGGLLAAQNYCVRLVADNGAVATATGVFETLAVPPTQVAPAFAAPRTDAAARVNAYVNPNGAPFKYRFEYSSDGGVSWNQLSEAEDTSRARIPVVVGSELAGLQPSTEYRYRLSAVETIGVSGSGGPAADLGDEKAFTTRSGEEMAIAPNASGEVEKRGIELVNNPNKGEQNVVPAEIGTFQPPISTDGERAIWGVNGGAPGSPSSYGGAFLATRSAAGWTSKSPIPPAAEQVGNGSFEYKVIAGTSSYSRFLFAAAEPRAITTGPATLVRIGEDGKQEKLFEFESQNTAPELVQVTENLDHVLLVNPQTHQIEDAGAEPSEPRKPLSIMPDGQPNACGLNEFGLSFGGPLVKNVTFGGAGELWEPGYAQIATTNASRVYFEAIPNGEPCTGHQALYERNLEAKKGKGETVAIDPGTSTTEPELIRVTPDGRHAYFLTASKLDPEGKDTNSDLDIYRWDEEAKAGDHYTCLTCVVPDANVLTRPGGKVLVSNDFSHLYFESTQALAPEATAGDRNVYVLSGGNISFVADLNDQAGALEHRNAKLSTDGAVLTFLTGGEGPAHFRLTADLLKEGDCVNAITGTGGGDCREVFRFDDGDESLECVSCSHDGLTSHQISAERPLKVSADGSTVAFATVEKLVPADINGSADLYEWRNGARRLVTDGETTFPASVGAVLAPAAVDQDGRNVFFKVADPGLTGFEQDGLANLYDARIGGGFARPTEQPHCAGESCQGPLQSPPPYSPSASSGQSRGNPPQCSKGKVRRKGRCVKPKVRHHHKARHAHRATGVKK